MYEYDRTGRKPLEPRYCKDKEARPNYQEKGTTPENVLLSTNETENKEGTSSLKFKEVKNRNKVITAPKTEPERSSLGMNQNENNKGKKEELMPTSMEAEKKPQQEPEIKSQQEGGSKSQKEAEMQKEAESMLQKEAESKLQQEAKALLKWAMKGEWQKVVERYKSNPDIHKVKITRSGETALHIAVLDEKEDIVEELVRLIDEKLKEKASTGTKQGDASATTKQGGASAATKQGDDSAVTKQGDASAGTKQGDASAATKQGDASAATKQGDDSAAKEKGSASAETPADHPLKIENERGDTPLHLAASIGNVRICSCIAAEHKDLVGARNKLAETPLFLAALHGKKDAFLHLHKICGGDKVYGTYRKKNGETILHCAIAGEHFDLAYQIIDKYGDLTNSVNEEGHTPLHLLASKPAVFRSGSHLGFFSKIIYHCMYVKKLEEMKEDFLPLGNATSNGKKADGKYPMNYQTCMNFQNMLTGMWNMLTRSGKKEKSGGQTISQNQDTLDENLKERTGDCLKDLWSITRKMAATCRKNSQNSDNQAKPNKHDPEDPVQGHASASQNEAEVEQATKENSEGAQKIPQNHGTEAVEDLLFPPNYYTCAEFVKFIYRAVMVVLGIGSREIKKIQLQKENHIWSDQIMKKLLECASTYDYDASAGKQPQGSRDDLGIPTVENEQKDQKDQKDQKADGKRITLNLKVLDVDFGKGEVTLAPVEENKQKSGNETPILIAAKNGITEMVKEILDRFPVAIHDMNSENKNMVLLAAENRQPEVYKLLLEKEIFKKTIFHAVDNEGNSALHLAAMATHHQPWLIPGAALQMQWEIKWYEYVEDSMPTHFFVRYNKANKTAREIFTEKHEYLVKNGSEWLNTTSNSCSVVAALIATVAFATSATVPGGIKEGKGTPTLEKRPAFNVFSISSLIALCFSVNSLVMFLAILTSRHQERDFGRNLPNKLLYGLSSLFISIAAILISFCAGHFFLLKDELKYAALPIYAVACLPVAFFAMMQFPLYLDLIWASIRKVPQRSCAGVS